MPFVRLESIDDPRLTPFRELPSSRREQREGVFVAEGHWLVERMWRSPHQVLSVLAAEDRLQDLADDLVASVPVYVLTATQLSAVVGYPFHRGVLGCGQRLETAGLINYVSGSLDNQPVWLALDGIADPENIGGILRNAAAFGAGGVLLGRGCADPYSRRVLRVSMGNVFKLRWLESPDLARDLRILRQELEFTSIATVLDPAAEALSTATRPGRMVLIFGSEGHGISAEVMASCDRRITIPMQLGTDSLNVATAAALFLYEFCNRRG